MTCAFLDIETSWEKTITIIGIYRSGEETIQLIAPEINRALLLQSLEGVEKIYTYNGTGFDLPVIERWLGVKLAGLAPHRDLMDDCWKRKLNGGRPPNQTGHAAARPPTRFCHRDLRRGRQYAPPDVGTGRSHQKGIAHRNGRPFNLRRPFQGGNPNGASRARQPSY